MKEEQKHLTNAQFQVVQKANAELAFPSDSKEIVVEVYYVRGQHLFICGINGKANTETIVEMEKHMLKDAQIFDKGDGRYLFNAWIEEEQKDHYGCVVASSYWWFEPLAFKSVDSDFEIPTTVEQVKAFEETFTPPVITDEMMEKAFDFILQAMRNTPDPA